MLYFFGMSITICKRFIFVNNYPIWIPIIDIIACDQLWNSTSIDVWWWFWCIRLQFGHMQLMQGLLRNIIHGFPHPVSLPFLKFHGNSWPIFPALKNLDIKLFSTKNLKKTWNLLKKNHSITKQNLHKVTYISTFIFVKLMGCYVVWWMTSEISFFDDWSVILRVGLQV